MPERPKGHDWKSCVPTKIGTEGSNVARPGQNQGIFMKRYFKYWMIFLTIVCVMLLTEEITPAQKYLTYVGKVVSIYKGTISVKGDKGEVMYFAVGRKTVYIPRRLPAVNERVKVSYYFRRGYNVAYQVEMISPPSKKK